eukprot:m.210982 g.210982  ORF g.210982 m.210982 type:complete len:637 (+) comp25341_c0_seq1:202-2112(+)
MPDDDAGNVTIVNSVASNGSVHHRGSEQRVTLKSDRRSGGSGSVKNPFMTAPSAINSHENGLPWPEPFPMYIGRAFLTNAAGIVDDIREVRYFDFEFYPHQKELPERSRGLARMKMHVFFLVPDATAPGGTRPNKDKEPNPLSFTRYVLVSTKHKTFQTRGFNMESHYAQMQTMETVKINEDWVYCECPLSSGLSVETMLNADNTVLRECNFNLDEVRRTGDWTKGALYAIRAPDPEEQRRPGRKIVPPPEDRTHEQMELFKTIFTSPPEAFWHPTSKERRPVDCALRFKALTAVNTKQELMTGRLELCFRFPISKTDIVEWVAAADQSAWVPSWTPPRFRVTNVASNSGGFTMRYLPYQLVNVDNKYYAKVTVDIRGNFYNQFKLQHYPFDVQRLTVELRAESTRARDCDVTTSVEIIDDNNRPLTIRDTEWMMLGAMVGAGFVPEPSETLAPGEAGMPEGRYCILGQACAQRHYGVYIYRVMSVMGLFSLMSMAALAPGPAINAMERMSYIATILLMAVVYSMVQTTEIPNTGYLTLLEKYALFTVLFIAIVSAEVVAVDWIATEYQTKYDEDDVMDGLTYINLACWVLLHLGLAVYIRWHVIPTELVKATRLHGEMCSLFRRETSTAAIHSTV